MKILIFSQYFYPESFRVNTLAKELVNRGHEVTVVTGFPQYPYGEIYEGYGFDIPYEKEWNGVKVERMKVLPRGHNSISMLMNCVSYVIEGYKWVNKCKEKFDAVYVFEVSPVTVGLPAIKYKKKFGTPVFFNVQDLWPENVIEVLGIRNKLIINVINKIVDYIYKYSDKILCASNGFVENIANRGVSRDKLIYWPQFCEEPDYENLVKPDCYSDEYFNIVFAGNLGYAQGLDLMIDTAELVKNENIRWYLVGDGRAKEELVNKVKEKQLADNVFFIGKVSEHEANCYVSFADCAYLSFTDNEIFKMTIPAKLQTYLACGAPIFAVADGETKKIIEDGNCGICTTSVDKLEVSQVLKNFLKESAQKYDYRNKSKKMYKLHFQKDTLIDNLIKLLRYEQI